MKFNRIIRTGKWLSIFVFSAYFYSMVVFPIMNGGPSNLFVVWDAWQTFNAGMIALLASVVALFTTNYIYINQRHAEMQAARSFLPHALSELCTYTSASASFYQQLLSSITKNSKYPNPFDQASSLNNHLRETLYRCILHSDNKARELIVKILSDLQVHEARLEGVNTILSQMNFDQIDANNIETYIIALAKIRSYVDLLFPYARGEEEVVQTTITEALLFNSLRAIGVMDLESNQIIDKVKRTAAKINK